MAEPKKKTVEEAKERYPKLEALGGSGPWDKRDQVFLEVLMEEYDGPILPREADS